MTPPQPPEPRRTNDLRCEEEGCDNGPANGHALYRTNPPGKGQGFRGRCGMHMGEAVEPVVSFVTGAIEEDNRRKKAGQS